MPSPNEPKLPSEAKRISESLEGIMRQLIVNAEDDEEIVLEVAIDADVPKNPIRNATNKDKSKQPQEYFNWGYFNQTPRVPRDYQFTRVINSKNARSLDGPSEVTTEQMEYSRTSQKKVESMTSTEYSHLQSSSSSQSKVCSSCRTSSSIMQGQKSLSSEAGSSTMLSTSELFPKALVQRVRNGNYDL